MDTQIAKQDKLQQLETGQIDKFLIAFGEAGGRLNDTTARMIERSIKKHKLTVEDLERGFMEAFEKESYMSWASVLKYAKEKKFDAEKVRAFYGS